MDWDQIESKWAAMTLRVRSDWAMQTAGMKSDVQPRGENGDVPTASLTERVITDATAASKTPLV